MLETPQVLEPKRERVMTESSPSGPVLFCFDGSEGSRSALRAAGDLINRPVDVIVLTVWETIETRLALGGGFTANFSVDSADMDASEEASARSAAEAGTAQATEHGYKAVPMVRRAPTGVATTILEVADEVSARLIVCGQRGRGAVRTALLGSVSHRLASHAQRPVLITPQPRADKA
jgi:nucleotide-binding universal stress UspA family protein